MTITMIKDDSPGHQKERHWTDAQIRWTAANHNLAGNDDGDDDEDDDSASAGPLFQPNDPNQVFSYRLQCMENQHTMIELQGYHEESDTIYVSTGLTLWRSSTLLCDFMVQSAASRLDRIIRKHPQQGQEGLSKRNLRVLELGAGLGLAGMVAQRVLFSHMNNTAGSTIVMTDGDTNALSLLRQNVKRNEPQSANDTAVLPKIVVEQLLWGQSTAETFYKRHGSFFDVILAADAIYVLENVKPLLATVKVLLERPSGEFWFSFCRRRQVSVQIENVLEAAESIGLDHELVKEDDDILVYVFSWKKKQQANICIE